MSAGGGCWTVETARTTFDLVKFMKCVELLFGKWFPLRLKWTVDKSNVCTAIHVGMMYGA